MGAVLGHTVGLLIWVIRTRGEWAGRILGWLIDVAWAYATIFVAPILVTRDLGPVDALTSSANLFRHTWGENLTKEFGFGILTFVAFVAAGGVALAVGAGLGFVPGIIVFAVLAAAILAVFQALESVFDAALYRYATSGEAPPAFAGLDLGQAFVNKKARS